MWVSAATSAAAAQAASGEPKAIECRLRVRDCVTAEKQCRSPGTSEAASLISARTGVIPRVPMICALVISAPSQCERSISSRPGDAGEEVLVAAREADDLVREDRADDQRDVVLDHVAVDPDVRGVLEHAVRELGDPLGADRADVRERRRFPPGVVEHGRAGIRARRGAPRAPPRSSRRGCRARRARSASSRARAARHGPRTAAAAAGCCACRPARARRRCARRGPRRRAGRARTRGSPRR